MMIAGRYPDAARANTGAVVADAARADASAVVANAAARRAAHASRIDVGRGEHQHRSRQDD
jgi:hypothetical protein